MKKTYILSALIASVFVVASCNLNKYPVFDDADAFVSFDKSSYVVNEAQGTKPDTLDITVTLASVSGISTTVTYDLIDNANPNALVAKQGYDWDFLDAEPVLKFDSENRTATIRILIYGNDYGKPYTGSKVFTLSFKSTGNVKPSKENTTTVTINDLDHPLTYILGTYVAVDAAGATWEMQLRKDDSNIDVVWFYDICNLGSWVGDDIMYFGSVDIQNNVISIPVGQESEYKYSNGNAVTLSLADDMYVYFTGSPLQAEISEGGKRIVINTSDDSKPFLFAYIKDAGRVSSVQMPITLTKK